MYKLAYFTVPTLVGWLVGSFTCVVCMTIVGNSSFHLRNVYFMGQVAGLLIIAPTFILCILPYCGFALRKLRLAKIKGDCRFSAWPLFFCLVWFGSIITFFPATVMFGNEHQNWKSSLPAENPILWFLPFIPYAAVVAFLSQMLFKLIQKQNC